MPHVMPPSNTGLRKSVANHRIAEPKSAPEFFDIAKSRLHSQATLRNTQEQSAPTTSSPRKILDKVNMPGATEPTQVQILDPTSEHNEEIDPAVDRDRIRVVR
jgi:hypothetical protein